jgi:hypothetical protein
MMHADPGRHRFVFIAGLHRSGTSFFHKALQQHPAVSGFSNTGVPEDEGQHLQSVYPPGIALGGPGCFAFHPAAHMDESSPLCNRDSAQKLFSEWAPYWNLDKPVLIEKSPTNLLKTRFLQALFPESWFIVILRHPVAVTLATFKATGANLDEAIRHWLHAHAIFGQDRSRLRRVLVVRYEDMVADPNRITNQVFRFVGLEPYRPLLDIDAGSNLRYFSAWEQIRITNSSAMAGLFERYSSAVERYGYSLRNPAQVLTSNA